MTSQLSFTDQFSGLRPQKSQRLPVRHSDKATPIRKLSVELWHGVVLHLQGDRKSTLAFTQTCRYFYWIGIRLVLTRLRYSTHHAFNYAHMNFWLANRNTSDKLHRCPIYLDFSVLPPSSHAMPSLAFTDPPIEFEENQHNAHVYKSIMSIMKNFTNLRTLYIHETAVMHSIYTVIGRLKELRELVVENCTFAPTKRNEIQLDFRTLPLTSLTLRGICETGADYTSPDVDTVYPLHLSTGLCLHKLSVAWTKHTKRFLAHSYPSLAPYALPTGLKNIHIFATPTPIPSLDDIAGFDLSPVTDADLGTPDGGLSGFLSLQAKLEEIELESFHFLNILPGSLRNLRVVRVKDNLDAHALLVAGGKVRHLDVNGTSTGLSWLEGLEASGFGSKISILSLKLAFWEPKVASIVRLACARVQVLDIKVDDLVSLSRLTNVWFTLPKLEKLRLRGNKDPSAKVADFPTKEMEHILSRWNQGCPLLQSVRLSSLGVWRKRGRKWVQFQ